MEFRLKHVFKAGKYESSVSKFFFSFEISKVFGSFFLIFYISVSIKIKNIITFLNFLDFGSTFKSKPSVISLKT